MTCACAGVVMAGRYATDVGRRTYAVGHLQDVPHTDHLERVFYSSRMRALDTDEQMLDQIADVCRWYAVAGPPTGQRQAAALAELAHITGGRTDLLAQYAGRSLARQGSSPDNAARERAAHLCIAAGADMGLIERRRRESRPR